jgi:hypothetical protein
MKQILYKLFEHQYLGRSEARDILQNIAQGKYSDAQIASLITVFLMRNISVEELCGFRDALLDMRIPVDLNEFSPIDIVGTTESAELFHRNVTHQKNGNQRGYLRITVFTLRYVLQNISRFAASQILVFKQYV